MSKKLMLSYIFYLILFVKIINLLKLYSCVTYFFSQQVANRQTTNFFASSNTYIKNILH